MKLFSPAIARQNRRKAAIKPVFPADKAEQRKLIEQAVQSNHITRIPMRQNRQVLSKRRNLKPWSAKALMS